jgi:hypothetical protein
MPLLAYLTLTDGTLVDLEMSADGSLLVRAGRSLDPSERPEVLRLTFGDLLDFNRAAVHLFQAYTEDQDG